MKIAVFHNVPPGGAKRVIYEQVKRLGSKHTLHLFLYDSTDDSFLPIRSCFQKVHSFPFALPQNLNRLVSDYRNLVVLRRLNQKIASLIDSSNFDVCLVHPDWLTQSPFLLRYLKTPSVYFCEELLRMAYEKELALKEKVVFWKKYYEEATRLMRKKIDQKNAAGASLILTASRYIKNKVQKKYGQKALVCKLGVDTQVFQPTKKLSNPQILFIGAKDKVTGYDFAFSVFKNLPLSLNLKLKVISFSKGKPRLTDKELASEYSSSILTLCTSYHEPFGLIALESMACQTPVLAVDQGGYQETILEGQTGFLIKRKARLFVQKITSLAQNPQVVKKMGQAGRKHVLKNFTWDQHVDCLEKSLRFFDKPTTPGVSVDFTPGVS